MGGGSQDFFMGWGGGGGGGKNILKYLFKYCRGFTYLASASGEPLLKLLLGGEGMSRNFSGMGGWKNIQTYF